MSCSAGVRECYKFRTSIIIIQCQIDDYQDRGNLTIKYNIIVGYSFRPVQYNEVRSLLCGHCFCNTIIVQHDTTQTILEFHRRKISNDTPKQFTHIVGVSFQRSAIETLLTIPFFQFAMRSEYRLINILQDSRETVCYSKMRIILFKLTHHCSGKCAKGDLTSLQKALDVIYHDQPSIPLEIQMSRISIQAGA